MTATYIFHSEFLWTVISQMHESESITVAITPSFSLSAAVCSGGGPTRTGQWGSLCWGAPCCHNSVFSSSNSWLRYWGFRLIGHKNVKSADACAQIPYLHVFHVLWCVKSIIKSRVKFEFAPHYTLYDVDLGDISACKRTRKARACTNRLQTTNQYLTLFLDYLLLIKLCSIFPWQYCDLWP